ncbi:MAG TPA: BlaI/MecI/CopY family transcriptional regulator [Planctomycetaceae bacterium]|jgi:predicted transcriptional regulator|nr:BlaI/MecI/CopY family transcriptional regulator [Planctomycetaceae bacterium]
MPARIRLTEAQFAVLEGLWLHGPQTIRQLMAAIYPAQSKSDYATVQKLLEQLEEKGCAHRDRSKMPHVFCAAVDRGDLIDAQLREMANRLCDGSLTPVLMHLVEDAKLTKRDRDTLRRLLDEASRRKSESERPKR